MKTPRLSLKNTAAALGIAALFAFGSAQLFSKNYAGETQSPEAVVGCLNELFWISREVQVIREGESATLLLDRIGWHVTWMAAVDFRETKPRAHDTFSEDDPLSGALFRRPMPWYVVGAFEICGVEYEGQLPSSVDTWILELEGFPEREPHDSPPPPQFYEVEDIRVILPPLR